MPIDLGIHPYRSARNSPQRLDRASLLPRASLPLSSESRCPCCSSRRFSCSSVIHSNDPERSARLPVSGGNQPLEVGLRDLLDCALLLRYAGTNRDLEALIAVVLRCDLNHAVPLVAFHAERIAQIALLLTIRAVESCFRAMIPGMEKKAIPRTGISRLLRDRKQTRADLMLALDVSEATVRRWERGEGLNSRNLRAIADHFGVSVDEVLDRSGSAA